MSSTHSETFFQSQSLDIVAQTAVYAQLALLVSAFQLCARVLGHRVPALSHAGGGQYTGKVAVSGKRNIMIT
jgi:hypothetical protein